MSAIAMVFPGHGAEQPRMGLALAERHAGARALLEHAGAVAGVDAFAVLRRGGDRLSDTRVLQPIMIAVLLGIVAALADRGIRPTHALGYSLGELAAWSALGGIAATRAIEVAGLRGRLLGEVAQTHAGAMLMLPALDDAGLAQVLAHGREAGEVDVAIEVGPDRVVLSGDRLALMRLVERFGGSFVATTGAWHGRRMATARAPFAAGLAELVEAPAPTPSLIANATGEALGEAPLVPMLVEQLDHRVRFAGCVATLARTLPGDAAVLVVGPPKPLRSLLASAWPGAVPTLHVVETPEDIAGLRVTEDQA